jgi:hypothetical protein
MMVKDFATSLTFEVTVSYYPHSPALQTRCSVNRQQPHQRGLANPPRSIASWLCRALGERRNELCGAYRKSRIVHKSPNQRIHRHPASQEKTPMSAKRFYDSALLILCACLSFGCGGGKTPIISK